MANPLVELKSQRQSVWYDNLNRELIKTGLLQRLVDDDGVSGGTSNPSIFEKAVGASVAANKIGGIRAAITHDTYSAHQGVEHDDMNVICLGSHVIGIDVALEVTEAFVGASFDAQERYVRRLAKVRAIEAGKTKTGKTQEISG